MTKLAIPIRRLVRFDGESSSVNYIGEASFNTASSDSTWRIFRLSYTGTGSFDLTYANGDDGFVHVWDDRASYSYS